MRQLYPLEINEGEDKTFKVELLRDQAGSYTIYNLTDCVCKSEVRDDSDQLVLQMQTRVDNPVSGVIYLTAVSADSIGKSGDYYWDIKIESPVGIDYLEASRFKIDKTVTN